MTAFYAGAALLSACALLFILPTLLRGERARRGPAARAVANLAVLRDQLRELDADLAAGTIDAAGYANSRSELERRVASDVP
ncbi:c-type cytochrome biogenesis protein CcmI, partial [Pseudoduganella sp. FT9W]